MANGSDNVTTEELHRRILSLEANLKDDIQALVNSQSRFIEDLSHLTREFSGAANNLSTIAEKLNNTERRLNSLESFNTWVVRTVLGALLIGAIGLLYTFSQQVP